jgi:hypothetical protein
VKGVSLWLSDIPLNLEHLFADYFESEAIYHVKIGGNFPEGSLLNSNESKLRPLGVKLDAAQLLMETGDLIWSMDEFLKKASDFAPTLVLIKMKNGTECGGLAGVPWPNNGWAADPTRDSFIFSLGATPARFDLVIPKWALFGMGFGFQFGSRSGELFVSSDGHGCSSARQGAYAGPREPGQLIGGTAGDYQQPYERWELWRL